MLIKLSPLAKSVENRQELEELILRFFALADQYPNFRTHRSGIGSVLDEYIDERNINFDKNQEAAKSSDFARMLSFVEKAFPNGFAKGRGQFVSRVFFEAVSVGVHLALKEKPDLKPRPVDVAKWLKDETFHAIVSGKYKTHAPQKIKQRVDYVKAQLLGAAGTTV